MMMIMYLILNSGCDFFIPVGELELGEKVVIARTATLFVTGKNQEGVKGIYKLHVQPGYLVGRAKK